MRNGERDCVVGPRRERLGSGLRAPRFLACVLLGATPLLLAADPGDELRRISASDGMPGPDSFTSGDRFGASTTIGEGLVVIGAPQAETSRTTQPGKTGAVYIFDAETGAELSKLIPSDGQESDRFGNSVAIDDGVVVVGAPMHDGSIFASNRGAVYFFDAQTGEQLSKIEPTSGTTDDRFGFSVAADDGIVAVAAPWDKELGLAAGAVYLYDIADPRAPVLVTKLLEPGGGPSRNFGGSVTNTPGQGVALDGSSLVIGAPGLTGQPRPEPAAHAVDISDPTNPVFKSRLVPDAGAVSGNGFGNAVGVHNGRAIIGEIFSDDAAFIGGAAYIFDVNTGEQIHQLLANDADTRDRLGSSVAIEGDIAVVGARSYAFGFGKAYFFNARTGEQIDVLTPSFHRLGDHFGFSVAIASGIAAIGADEAWPDTLGFTPRPGYAAIFDASFDDDCPADLNDDAAVDANDFFDYLDLFSSGDPAADLTGQGGDPDGMLDADDFFQFLNLFAAGCP